MSVRYPLFAAELDEVFAEADFLLALLTSAAIRWEVYSQGLGSASVTRFRRRVADRRGRAQLAGLFGATEGQLDQTLADAHSRLRVDQRMWPRPPAQLFPERPE